MISLICPTYDRPVLMLHRLIPSVLAQNYTDWELLIVGDGADPRVGAAVRRVGHPRIFYIDGPRQDYPTDPEQAWCVYGTQAQNIGLDAAQGEYVMAVGDDDALPQRSLELLLRSALIDKGAAYGRTEVIDATGTVRGVIGRNPPELAHIQNVLWRRSLGYRWDTEAWRKGLPQDWELYSRMIAGGVPFAFVPDVCYRYFPAHKTPVDYD